MDMDAQEFAKGDIVLHMMRIPRKVSQRQDLKGLQSRSFLFISKNLWGFGLQITERVLQCVDNYKVSP